MLERTREGHAQERREERSEGPPPARGVEVDPRSTIPGAARLAEPSGHPIWPGFFGAEAEDARAAGLGRWQRPRHLGGLLCVRPLDCLLARAASLPARSAPAGGGVRLPGGLGERARRLGRARQMTGVIYIASTWVPLAVASTFPRAFSRGESRRHFAADNEILAANCSRGRCPSGKAREEGSERWRGREDMGDQGELHGEEAVSTEVSRSPLTRGRGWKRDGDGGGRQGGVSVQIDILGCPGREPPPPSNVRAGRVAAWCAPGLPI